MGGEQIHIGDEVIFGPYCVVVVLQPHPAPRLIPLRGTQ